MDVESFFNFLFNTYEGIGISILCFLVLSVAAAVISERFTRKKYRDRKTPEDEVEFNSDDDDDD